MDEDWRIPLGSALVIVVVVAMIVAFATFGINRSAWRTEAVQRGFARWVVTGPEGGVKWEWINEK